MFSPAQGQDRTALVKVTIIDGTDHPPRTHSTVIVQGNKIVAITAESEKPPEGAKMMDGTGKFLIPGLWNNDLHGPAYGDAKAPLLSLVSYGVTTVRDMGAPLDYIVKLRAASASGALVGPRLFIAGPLMEGPIPIQMALIVDLFSDVQARDEVGSLEQHQVDYLEVDTSLTSGLYSAIADEARRRHLPLVGYIPATVSAWDIVKAHQTDVEHLGGRYLNVLISCSSDEAYFNHVIRQAYDDLPPAVKEKRLENEPQFKADFDERLLSTFNESKAQRLVGLNAKSGVAQTPTLYVLKTLWDTNKDVHKLNEHDMEFGKKIGRRSRSVLLTA